MKPISNRIIILDLLLSFEKSVMPHTDECKEIATRKVRKNMAIELHTKTSLRRTKMCVSCRRSNSRPFSELEVLQKRHAKAQAAYSGPGKCLVHKEFFFQYEIVNIQRKGNFPRALG